MTEKEFLDVFPHLKVDAELEALLDLEVTPEAEVLEIPITEKLRISVNDIGLLMPFIHFVEE